MSLVCRSTLVVLVMTSAFWPVPAHAESVPPHFVSMTKELLLAVRDDFTAAIGTDEQAQRLQRIYRILRREGLYNWRVTPFTRDGFVPKMAAVFGLSQIGSAGIEKFMKFLETQTGGRADAAIDELYTALGRARPTGAARKRIVDGWTALWTKTWAGVALAHEIEASRGPQTISLTWDMARARFTIRVIDDSDASTKEMQTTINGVIRLEIDQQAQNLIVSVKPAQIAITSGKRETQSAAGQPAQPRVGPPVKGSEEKGEDNGKASGKGDVKGNGKGSTKGESSPENRPGKQEQIDAKRQQLEEIKSDKVYVWENTKTGEKIRQKRFRKLKEPFEYLGEDYADPGGTEEINRIEREIAALESGSPPPPETNEVPDDRPRENFGTMPDTGNTTPSTPRGGAVISLAKKIYFHDEPVVVTYSISKDRINRIVFEPLAKGQNILKEILDYRKNSFEMWLDTHSDVPFIDYAIYLNGEPGTTSYIRVVRHEPLLPNAIKIAGGANHGFGEAVVVDVDVPSGTIVGRGDRANRGAKRHFSFRVVQVGRRLRGGGLTTDSGAEKTWGIGAPHSRFHLPYLEPGTYELRLVTDGFTVDQKRLNISVNELPNSLRLSSPGPIRAGENISVVFDAPGNLPKNYSYSLELLRLVKGGRMERASMTATHLTPGQPIVVGGARQGGNYAIRLLLNGGSSDGPYILDELDFAVAAPQSSVDRFHFTINGISAYSDKEIMIQQGEKIPVEVSLRGKMFMPGAVLKVRLYKAGGNANERMRGIHMSTPRSDDPIKEWNFDSMRKSAWKLDKNLPPGIYDLTIFMELDDKKIPFFARTFQVVPGFGSVKLDLDRRRVFAHGEPIAFTVKLPNGFSLSPRTLKLEFVRMGGRVPGCAIQTFVVPRSPSGMITVDGRESYSFGPVRQTGIYLIRLFYERRFTVATLLDEIAIEVVSRPVEGALQLSGTRQYRPGEKIRVTLPQPPDHPLQGQMGNSDPGSMAGNAAIPWILIIRHGAIAAGGGVSHANDMYGDNQAFSNSASSWVDGTKSDEFALNFPGSYEVRAFQHNGSQMAVQPFVVRDPRSPFTLNAGLGRIDLRNDLPRRDDPWPPIGEYLTGEDCKPRMVKAEKMKLRFVRWEWENRKYVPVEGALDFGAAIYLEGKLEEEARKDSYIAKMKTPDGGEQDVTLFISENDPTVVRSELLYFIWDSEPDANDPRR